MPLPMKTLREVAMELGMPEPEIRALVDMNKVRAVIKKGVPFFAPDEIARIKRQRKTLPESATKSAAPATPVPAKPGLPKPGLPKKAQPPKKVGR